MNSMEISNGKLGPCSGTREYWQLRRRFQIDIRSLEPHVKREVHGLGLRLAALHELLAFRTTYPDKQKEFPIVALGSTWCRSNTMVVPYLDGIAAAGKRGLSIGAYHLGWLSHYGSRSQRIVRNKTEERLARTASLECEINAGLQTRKLECIVGTVGTSFPVSCERLRIINSSESWLYARGIAYV